MRRTTGFDGACKIARHVGLYRGALRGGQSRSRRCDQPVGCLINGAHRGDRRQAGEYHVALPRDFRRRVDQGQPRDAGRGSACGGVGIATASRYAGAGQVARHAPAHCPQSDHARTQHHDLLRAVLMPCRSAAAAAHRRRPAVWRSCPSVRTAPSHRRDRRNGCSLHTNPPLGHRVRRPRCFSRA